MRLKVEKLGRIAVPRNNVIAGVKTAYINAMIQNGKFKREFLSCWDGVSAFSLFNHPKRVEMIKLLKIQNQFEGDTNLSKAREGLKDLQLIWNVRPHLIDTATQEQIISNIKTDIIDKNGYEVTFAGVNKPIKCKEKTLIEDDEILVYDIIIDHIAKKGLGTYIFTFEQIRSHLIFKIFKEDHTQEDYDVQTISGKARIDLNAQEHKLDTHGIAQLASFGVADLKIDASKIKELESDEFVSFVQNFIDFKQVKKKRSFWQTFLTFALVAIAIFTIAFAIGAGALAFSAGTGFSGFVTSMTAVGLSTTAYGVTVGVVLAVANIASAVMTLGAKNDNEPKQETQTPTEAHAQFEVADEMRWTYHDSFKPEVQILGYLEANKP